MEKEYENQELDTVVNEDEGTKEEDQKPETYEINLDFDQLAAWRDAEKDDLPVCGMISFFKASGASAIIFEHQDRFKDAAAPLDVFACNFYTQQRIKKFIAERWEIFSLSLEGNNKVTWNTRTYNKGEEHYHRRPSKRVTKSLSYDFFSYCPALNDDLPDNVLVVTIPNAVPATEEDATNS